MKNPYMKFQNPSMYGLEVMLCIKKRNGRTDGRTHARTNVPEAICPSNFFEVGGIKKHSPHISYKDSRPCPTVSQSQLDALVTYQQVVEWLFEILGQVW